MSAARKPPPPAAPVGHITAAEGHAIAISCAASTLSALYHGVEHGMDAGETCEVLLAVRDRLRAIAAEVSP